LQTENVALRHQIGVLQPGRKQPRLNPADRIFWVWLSPLWFDWSSVLVIVKPENLIAWHRKGFRLYWAWKSRQVALGRRSIPREVSDLTQKMSQVNPLSGAPRIHGELLKLGINPSQATVAKYMNRRRMPSQSWRTFLNNHVRDLVAVDFLTVPTVGFRVLFVFVILAHNRPKHIHFNVTDCPLQSGQLAKLFKPFPGTQLRGISCKIATVSMERIFGDSSS
jgi:putative transposase